MSLHTKYRPTRLDQVLGQERTVRDLEKVIKEGRAKTFLFAGPSGCGKTTIARILANRFAGGKATQANIEEINAAEYSGVDAMRGVLTRTMYRAVGSSPTKSIIVDESHALSGAAWRSLLKPIEEPPSHVFWMFCTTDPGKVPNTIITRCLRYDLKSVSEDLIFELLDKVNQAEQLDRPDCVLEAITEAAGGSPRQALVHLEKCAACQTAGDVATALRSAAQSKTVIDLCRWLLNPQSNAPAWADALKYIEALKEVEAESTRIVVVNYLSIVLQNTTANDRARSILGILEAFEGPYNTSDKLAPLLRSIGLAIGLDRG